MLEAEDGVPTGHLLRRFEDENPSPRQAAVTLGCSLQGLDSTKPAVSFQYSKCL